MGNGENWEGEHYFGYLDTVSHLNDPPTGPKRTPREEKKELSPVMVKIIIGLCIFDIIGMIFLLIIGA